MLDLRPGAKENLPSLPSERSTAPQGTVVDPAGLPVSGAAVELVTPPNDTQQAAENLCSRALAGLGYLFASADREGRFSLLGLAPGRRLFRVRREGYATVEQDIVIGAGGGVVHRTVTLHPAGALTVEVDASASGESPPFDVLLERELTSSLYAG